MWICEVVVTFVSALIGIDIPTDLYEGPYTVVDSRGFPSHYESKQACDDEAKKNHPRWVLNEVHKHGTDGLQVIWTCIIDERKG